RAAQEFKKSLVIFGAVLGVDVESHRMAGADYIEPNAALEAGAGAPTKLALHLVLGDEIARIDRHVQESIDCLPRDLGGHGAELRPLAGQPKGLGHCVDGRPDHWVIGRLGNPLAHEEYVHTAPAQRGQVVVRVRDWPLEISPERLGGIHDVLLGYAFSISLSL